MILFVVDSDSSYLSNKVQYARFCKAEGTELFFFSKIPFKKKKKERKKGGQKAPMSSYFLLVSLNITQGSHGSLPSFSVFTELLNLLRFVMSTNLASGSSNVRR